MVMVAAPPVTMHLGRSDASPTRRQRFAVLGQTDFDQASELNRARLLEIMGHRVADEVGIGPDRQPQLPGDFPGFPRSSM